VNRNTSPHTPLGSQGETKDLSAQPLPKIKMPRLILGYGALSILLYLALRNAPLSQIWNTLGNLQLWQAGILLVINIFICALITLRWWLIVRAESKSIPYVPLLGARLAVFGVSYFTFGPQVGGETLQVLFLQSKYGITYTRATASVIMDKLLEFLANFFLLTLGLTAILQAGVLRTNAGSSFLGLGAVVLLMTWPPAHILLLHRGRYPLSALLRIFPRTKVTRFISASERLAGTFCQRHLSALILSALISLAAGASLIMEYALIVSFLHIELSIWQSIAAWTAGWLAFLTPLPGGLGALEASQVFVLGAFGISAASAISVTLLIRGRDILIGGLGLILAGRGFGK
jgi:glycosyltransferase 2 family protein